MENQRLFVKSYTTQSVSRRPPAFLIFLYCMIYTFSKMMLSYLCDIWRNLVSVVGPPNMYKVKPPIPCNSHHISVCSSTHARANDTQ